MHLICLSVSHHTTPVELRECLSLSPEAIADALKQHPIRAGRFVPLRELAVLSTCHRLEIYALVALAAGAADEAGAAGDLLLDYLRHAFGLPIDQMAPHFQARVGVAASRHLFEVAAGLDSIAIGETQILGQVIRALDLALRLGCAGHVLSTLFRSAIHAGKRVHSETEVGRYRTSISALAVQLADVRLGPLSDLSVLVVGAGKMGGYALAALRALGVRRLTLINRTYAQAEAMAADFGAQVLPFEQLLEGVAGADVVFTSTAAPLPILHFDLIAAAVARRPGQSLTLIDLAVPRNVEGRAKTLPGVQVYDMDALQVFVKEAPPDNCQAIVAANAIVDEAVAEFETVLRIMPFIGELHKKAEAIRQRVVARALGKLRDPDPQVSEQIECLSQALVRKILHEPSMQLRTVRDPEMLNSYVDVLGRLFDLDEAAASAWSGQSETWNQ